MGFPSELAEIAADHSLVGRKRGGRAAGGVREGASPRRLDEGRLDAGRLVLDLAADLGQLMPRLTAVMGA